MKKLVLAAMAGCCAFACADAGQAKGALAVAVRGKAPDCRVVIPEKPSHCQRNAAEEFVTWTEKVSGVRLPIVTDAEPLPAKAVVLGPTRYTQELLGGEAPEGYPESAFRLKLSGSRLVVAAGSGHAVLYGVYEVLQRYAGVEFFTPDIVTTPAGDLVVPAGLDELVKPSVAVRDILCPTRFLDTAASVRFRYNGTHVAKTGNDRAEWGGEPCTLNWDADFCHCHSLHVIASKEEFEKTHPEYFFKDSNGVSRVAFSKEPQLCLTNPDVIRLGKERLVNALRTRPRATWFGISQEDSTAWCQCADCRAIDDREGGAAGTLCEYLNIMADEMAKVRPEARLTTLAYHQTRNPPKFLELRKNVLVGLCVTECDFSRPLVGHPNEGNRTFLTALERWSKISGGVWIWDYCTDYEWFPMAMPDIGALAANIRLFADNKVQYVYESGDGCPYSFFFDLKAYVISRMLWNAHQPLEPLVRRFMRACYGPAAGEARAALDLFEKHDFDRTKLRMSYAIDATKKEFFPTALFDRAAAHWKKAARLVGKREPYAEMVRRGRIGNDSVRLVRYCYDLACGDRPETDTPEYRAEMLVAAKEFMEVENARLAAAKVGPDGKKKEPWIWGWAMDSRSYYRELIEAFLAGRPIPKRVRGEWVRH